MNKKLSIWLLCFSVSVVLIQNACINQNEEKKEDKPDVKKESSPVYKKPSSNYRDSLHINSPAAVFYHPDSLQLLRIKATMDSTVYDATMHEFFYQMRNARIVIKKNKPGLKIIEAKNCRYLVFHKKDGTAEFIDLDTKNDAYGLFLFNLNKSPLLVDIMNIDTALSFYFEE